MVSRHAAGARGGQKLFCGIYSMFKCSFDEFVIMRWMKLEPIIQSEVSQKEKHQYSILTHIFGIYKKKTSTEHVGSRVPRTAMQQKIDSLRNLRATDSLMINVSQPQAREK